MMVRFCAKMPKYLRCKNKTNMNCGSHIKRTFQKVGEITLFQICHTSIKQTIHIEICTLELFLLNMHIRRTYMEVIVDFGFELINADNNNMQ